MGGRRGEATLFRQVMNQQRYRSPEGHRQDTGYKQALWKLQAGGCFRRGPGGIGCVIRFVEFRKPSESPHSQVTIQ